jgi:hypothetical protein
MYYKLECRFIKLLRTKKILPRHSSLVAILLVAFALRVYNLENIPNGLFIDEAARGYDAFAISRTGADMFGERLPLFLRGFDDYTPGLYVYLTVPFVYFLDLSRFSTRIASVYIGVLTVVVSYWAIRRPFGQSAALVGAGLLAPTFTIVLAYRGLRRPRWLIAAGVVGGISLYGYAPVKAFLPVLLIGFIAFYRRELVWQRGAALTAGTVLTIFAIPVYLFSFTASGRIRFEEVASFYNVSWQETLYLLVNNYFAYLHPKFLFMTDISQPDFFFSQRLKYVGLLYWFELPLILLGLFHLLKLGQRRHYFWLFWLLVAPIGINLLTNTKPALWLTATPTLHGLAGAGLVYLIRLFLRGFTSGSLFKISLQRALTAMVLVSLLITAIINVATMLDDLLTKFPVYATYTPDWGYGMDKGIEDLVRLQPAFDQANLDTFGVVAGIYLAYYTQYSPHRRQAEIAKHGNNTTWQRVGPITVGEIERHSLQPGCHVSLTRSEKRFKIPAPNVLLISYTLPDGQPSSLLMSAIASPQSESKSVQAIFENQILLDSFSLARTKSDEVLSMEPGEAICVILNWQSTGNLSNDYTVFVHLVGPTNPATNTLLWTQHDSMPVESLRPTSSWQPGEVIRDMHVLFIPTDAPPATYQLNAGLYEPITGKRLLVQRGGDERQDQVTLLEIDVR